MMFPEALADVIHHHIENVNAAIERVCEEAIQTGTSGVLVIRHRDGSVSVGVSDHVPYGQIYDKTE